MRILFIPAIIFLGLTSSLAEAANPKLTQEIALLREQVVFLQKELNRLNSVINLGRMALFA